MTLKLWRSRIPQPHSGRADRVATRKLDQLDSVVSVAELRIPPNNRLKALKGKRKGQFSIRINDQYRICFVWTEAGPDAVEIVDYH